MIFHRFLNIYSVDEVGQHDPKVEGSKFSETLVSACKPTWRYNTEDQRRHIDFGENSDLVYSISCSFLFIMIKTVVVRSHVTSRECACVCMYVCMYYAVLCVHRPSHHTALQQFPSTPSPV
jgi:hypothetical protein